MSNEKYFTCQFFNKKDFEIQKTFSLKQPEILQDSSNRFKVHDVEYKCQWNENNFNIKHPTLIVPIKNNIKLLDYTLNNFKSKRLLDIVNVIVVDDRSDSPLLRKCEEFNVNYLRVDNNKGFNFSMLNNIASFIVEKLGGEKVIFWNSDLWIDKLEHFKELILRHDTESSTISGSKLLYPYESLNSEDSTNVKVHFPHMTEGRYKGTVQFGGTKWIPSQNGFVPIHFKRFADKNDHRVNSDFGTESVTGALQVVNVKWFIKAGGFNPSLSKVFQDVDLCLRAVKDNKKVYYFGKDIHFYHDESLNFYSENSEKKMDKQFESDSVLFAKIWSKEITNLIF